MHCCPLHSGRPRTVFKPPLLTAAAFLLLLVSSLPTPQAQAETVARVNGAPITRKELNAAVNRLQMLRETQSAAAVEWTAAQIEEEALEGLIDRRLLVDTSRAAGIRVDEREVDVYIEHTRDRYDDEAAFQAALGDMDLTEAEVRRRYREDAAVGKLLEEKVGSRVTVSEEEVAAFYQEHMDRFIKPSQVRAAHILIRVPAKAGPGQREQARKRIESLRNRILAGEDFAMLAIEYSEGPSGVRGGDLGYFVRDQVEPPLADAAFSLEVGQTSGIVESDLGYHLVRVLDRRPPSPIPLDAVRERLGRRLRREKIARQVEAYVGHVKAAARIERYPQRPGLP